MTKSAEIYATTLNLCGSSIPDQAFQDILDEEHALLDPAFKKTLEGRRKTAVVASD